MIQEMRKIGAGTINKPSLHLVIAEDNEWWSEKLQGLAGQLRQWSFARTGQFDLSVHACPTVERFENLVEGLLSDGALVYVTLDLNMPLNEGENTPASEAGERMISSCLLWKRQGYRLEFCLISELDDFLEKLHRESSELRKLGVRKIHKNEILKNGGQRNLLDVLIDIQSFVRRHLYFCTVELPPGSGERVPIWFGGKEPLLDLLNRADQIAGGDAGLYLVFADAGGFEVDWVKLCCELRGLQLTDLDIAKADPVLHPIEWRRPFEDPPEALLVRNLDQAKDKECEIAPLLEKAKFFEKVVKRNALVFFQFPRFDTQLDVSKLDLTTEVPILEACLNHIYRDHPSRPLHQGLLFAFEDHRRIVKFPSYAVLRNAGVVEKTVELQMQESQSRKGCDGVIIDPELSELLVEIPWDEKGGFHRLRRAIQGAYDSFSEDSRGEGLLVKEQHFKSSVVVVAESGSDLGFIVRGRRLFRLIETRDLSVMPGSTFEGEGDEAEQALRLLEVLWHLYDGLHRLRDLRDRLGHQPSDKTFTPQDYEALSQARSFLDSLFDDPINLRRLIDEFRLNRKRRAWRDYYPPLADSRTAAVENIEFTWPFSRLPLHPSVFAYLQQNGVSPLIQKEIEAKLQRYYPDLEVQWEEAKRERVRLRREMTRREDERRRAERYAREAHSQPVLVHLVPRVKQEDVRSPFQTILSSFLIFNSFMALAENHYVFSSSLFTDKDDLKGVVEKVELGYMVGFLSRYAKKVRTSSQKDLSLFKRWTDRWAEAGRQLDSLRLAGHLAGHMLSADKYRGGWRPDEQAFLEKIVAAAKAENVERKCSIGTILNFLLTLRNAYFKSTGADFEKDYALGLRDFMRRFLAATTEAYRLGRVTSGYGIELWRKEAGEQSESASLLADASIWQDRLVVVGEVPAPNAEGLVYKALFPIDDLIRLRPVQDSIWAYHKDIWLDLTHIEGSDEALRLSATKEEWLPNKKSLTSSRLWKSIYDAQS